MHLGVAIHAVARDQELARPGAGQPLTVIELAGVKRGGVTLLAQKRAPGCEQSIVDRPVRTMTEAAVLGRGRMLVDPRPHDFLVARCAGVGAGSGRELGAAVLTTESTGSRPVIVTVALSLPPTGLASSSVAEAVTVSVSLKPALPLTWALKVQL